MNPNGLLDDVLRFIYITNGLTLTHVNRTFIVDDFHKSINRAILKKCLDEGYDYSPLDYTDSQEILEKLTDDGYLKQTQMKQMYEPPIAFYSTTFEGRWFINNGGYEIAEKSSQREKIWALSIERKTIQNASKMTALTLILAVGTSISAVYYLMEMVKMRLLLSLTLWTVFVIFLSGLISGLMIYLIIQQVLHQKGKERT